MIKKPYMSFGLALELKTMSRLFVWFILVYQKIIIFSNIGSKTGLELKEELFNIFNVPIPNVITSLDLLLKFLEKKYDYQ